MSLFFDFCSADSIGGMLSIVIQFLALAVFARALLSWFRPDPRNPLVQTLDAITEPILQPLRQIVPRLGMFDLTPIVAIFVLYTMARLLCRAEF